MKKNTKINAFLLFCLFMIVSVTAVFSACEQKETKYDVAIRVACSDGEVYEFPFGEYEKHIEIPYDGISRTFTVTKYWLKGFYQYDGWLDIITPWDNNFLTRCYDIGEGKRHEQVLSIVEPGNYRVDIETDYGIRHLADYTAWSLYITIK